MDPLSIAAGSIAVNQIADRIVSVCKDYISTVRDAPKDLRAIMIEVGGVKSALEVLQFLISQEGDDKASVILETFRSSEGPISGYRQALYGLDSLFPQAECNTTGGKRRKILTNLAWPFK